MIKCKKCGTPNIEYSTICEECATEFEVSESEAKALYRSANSSMQCANYIEAVKIYKFLAELGVSDAERELAVLLENGQLIPRDLEMATNYFFSAAKKGDAFSAYKYAKLVSRINASTADFWLAYAAMMDCKESFADAAMLYSKYSDEETASYYIQLCADAGEVDAIVELARRYLYGIGVKESEEVARWYIGKLDKIPIFALKLWNRLRVVKNTKEPDELIFANQNKILRALIFEAKKQCLREPLINLATTLSKCKTADASVDLALLYIEGVEFEQDIDMGVMLLKEACENGAAVAAYYLGNLFVEGKYIPKNEKIAIEYYRLAVELGGDGVFEQLGDIFIDGSLCPPEPILALSLFEMGANDKNKACEKKAYKIKKERERSYLEACRLEKISPEEAFPYLKSSVDAGYNLAHAKIAYYYEFGIGTKKNNASAFHHYSTALDLGDERAHEGMGRCYARGIGVAFNFNKAAEHLSKAKELGSKTADRELFRIYENKKRHMVRSLYSTAIRLFYNKKFALSKSMLEVCISFGLPEAIYTIGCLYEFGITVPADRATAKKFYDKSAELGYVDRAGAHKQKILKMSK